MNSSNRPVTAVARPAPRVNTVLAAWTGAVLLLATFGLGDAAVVAYSADVVTAGQLFAFWMAYILISFGILFTLCKVKA